MNYLEELKVNPDNPRFIREEDFEKLINSLREFPEMLEKRPIVYDENNVILGGNMRFRALQELVKEGFEIKDEYFQSAEGWTEEQKRAFVIKDNAMLGNWDTDILANKWDDLPLDDWGIDTDPWAEEEEKYVESEPIKKLKDIKILNLYAGIGGNRKLWGDCQVTAVEYNEKIAKVYQDYFPNDIVIVDDAHVYLEEHFDEFDFIWTSPPCPTHSKMRKWGVDSLNYKPVYPDLKLYEEILFLQGYHKGKWVVENVKSWYNPLIEPKEIGRHYYWTNFDIDTNIAESVIGKERIPKYQEEKKDKSKWGFDLNKYKLDSEYPAQKILNNMVHPKTGKFILESAYGI